MKHRWLPISPDQNMVHAAYKSQPEAISVGFAQVYRTMVAAAPRASHPAVAALRHFAIVNHWKGTGEYKQPAWGQRCRCCGAIWQRDQPETHLDNCPLKETE